MKRTILLAVCVALSVGFAIPVYCADPPKAKEGAEATVDAPKIKYGQTVGDNISPVTLEALDGSKKVEINTLSEKTLFINLSSVCTSCRKEIQEISENIDKFKGKLEIYGVVIDMDPRAAAQRIGPTPFPLLMDSEYKLGNAVNLLSTPSSVIVENGKILYSKAGYRPGQWKEYLK